MAGAQKPETVSTRRQRIAEFAQQNKQMAFTSLNHHLTLSLLLEALGGAASPSWAEASSGNSARTRTAAPATQRNRRGGRSRVSMVIGNS